MFQGLLGIGGIMFIGWLAWLTATIWAGVRAFNGQPGTQPFEGLLLFRPKSSDVRQLARTR